VQAANAILHARCKTRVCRCPKRKRHVNAELIESAITEKTKAIIPVHLYGQMCDMIRIREHADKYNLKTIEDAAHSIEASREGIRVGQLADTRLLQFLCHKNITSGEGGQLLLTGNCLRKYQDAETAWNQQGAARRYTKKYEHWICRF